jgi:hypothetical protein
MNLKESCSLDQDNFDHVKSIEKEVYPPRMQTYQDFDDIEELLDYNDCDGQIDCIIKNDWYAIFCNGPTEVEITDFASRKPLGFAEILEVKNKLQSFGDKIISMNARESTSYKLIKLGERRGWFEIISDKTNITFGETMHEIIMKVIPQTSFKEWLYIIETIDANTKNLLTKQKAPQDQLNAFIKELEDEPTIIDKPTAFQRFQAKFVTNKEKPKDEDAQRKYFATIPNTTEEELQTYDYYKTENKESLRQMMEQLRKFIDKKLITLKIENNIPVIYRNTTQGSNKLDTPDFGRLTSELHSIRDSLEKYSAKSNYFNPIELELNHAEHLVAKGDNIWVFKGHRPNICRILGKNQRWCISDSNSAAYWFTYRISHHQTQYFVFDFNKDENDPARYVNPGVAPEGRYSEWVDARNTHSPDPDARRSQVGINGYKSINEYKKYLESKGIPLNTWTTTKPEDWEERLQSYYELNQEEDDFFDGNSFKAAKNDEHPEVFDMYLKIANKINDVRFSTLTDNQKKEFLLGKAVYEITMKQFDYAIENFKGEYYNSLDLDNKVKFAVRTNDQDKFLKLAENIKLTDANITDLIRHATNKDKILEIIIKHKLEIDEHSAVYYLSTATDIDKIEETFIKYKPKIFELLFGLPSSDNAYSTLYVYSLLDKTKEVDKMAELIIKYSPEITGGVFSSLISSAIDKDKIIKLLINKRMYFFDEEVKHMLNYAKNTDEIAKLIIEKQTEFSLANVSNFFQRVTESSIDEIAKLIIQKQTEFTDPIVSVFIRYAIDKQKIAELLQRKSDNISKLSNGNVEQLFDKASDNNIKITIAKIINQYHTNKTPEIKELISKYL